MGLGGIAGSQEITGMCSGSLSPFFRSSVLAALLNVSPNTAGTQKHAGHRGRIRCTLPRALGSSSSLAALTVSVGVIQSHDGRAGRQQRFLQRAGGNVPGVQPVAPLIFLLLLPVSSPCPRLAVAQTGAACGERG